MNKEILLFGITKDILGGPTYRATLEEGSTVGQLKAKLVSDYPQLDGLASLMVAVNNTYAQDDQVIHPNDEIALIPPVSGG